MTPLVEEIAPAPDPVRCCEALEGLAYRLFLDSASTRSRLGRYSFLAADPVAVVRSHAAADRMPRSRERQCQSSHRRSARHAA